MVYAVEEALRIIGGYQRPDRPAVDGASRGRGPGTASARPPVGCCTTATPWTPDGLIRAATIVPPTSQNQGAIEDDLRRVAEASLDLDDAALTSLVRAGDPQL